MLITRRSPFTGKENTLDIDVTPQQMALLEQPRHIRPLIQDIFPNLTADEREFILTGYTPEDWDALFGEEEEDDE